MGASTYDQRNIASSETQVRTEQNRAARKSFFAFGPRKGAFSHAGRAKKELYRIPAAPKMVRTLAKQANLGEVITHKTYCELVAR